MTDNSRVYRECGEGWNSLIDPIVEMIDDTDGTIQRIKERYGRLRIYHLAGDGEIDDSIDNAIDAANERSATMCEICGAPARLMFARGWYKTLDDKCAKELGYTERA